MDKERAMELYNKGSKSYRRIYKLWTGVSDEMMAGMHIHHIDHDHSNNHPENLELLTPDQHAMKHGFINNFVMSQSTAIERAAHPEVRKRVAEKIKGRNNGSYGISFRSRFSTEKEYEAFCIKNRRGKNNSQYGNVGRITGDKNPMRNLTPEQRDAWRDKLSRPATKEALVNIRLAAKDPERREKISKKMKGNKSNQVFQDKIRNMCEVELKAYLEDKKPSFIKYVNNIINPPEKKKPYVKPPPKTKEQSERDLILRLKSLSDKEFQEKIDGKGKKYVNKLIRLRNMPITTE